MSDKAEDRQRVLALLTEQHTFPGPFSFRAVTKPADRGAPVAAVSSLLGEGSMLGVDERASKGGKYVSVRMQTTCSSPEQVLEVYAVLEATTGVITVL